jgi:predicted acyl esterase
VAWLGRQEWFDGRLAALGASNLGYTAWSLAMDPPPELKALVVTKTVHDLHAAAYAQGLFIWPSTAATPCPSPLSRLLTRTHSPMTWEGPLPPP